MSLLYCDLETFSPVGLKKHGTYRYAAEAEVLLWTYAFDEGEVQCWDVTAEPEMPDDLKATLADENVTTVWHNGGGFDTVVLDAVGIHIPMSRVFDTMACAYAHSLPGSLDTLCQVLKVDASNVKHSTGKKLIQLFCKPRPKNMKVRRATSATHPKEWAEFVAYAKADITAMREVYAKLPKWNYKGFEYDLWLLDQKINRRGVAVDLELANAALRAADKAKEALAEEIAEQTSGEVQTAGQRDALLAYLWEAHGIHMEDLRKSTAESLLSSEDLPEDVRELLLIRSQATMTSTSKYKAFIDATSADGRFRGALRFCGASRTGRWSSVKVQLQNLARPTMKNAEIELAVSTIKQDSAHLVYDNVMKVLSNCIRGTIVSPKEQKLIVSDLANIEGRLAAWLAGEEWKIKAFNEFDAGVGADLYKLAYAKSFNVDAASVDKEQRSIGKVMELMLQYSGGVGAFVTGAATYRVDLDDMADKALPNIPEETIAEARKFLEYCTKEGSGTHDLSEKAFLACDSLKRLWRGAHPAISSYWKELEDAFREATNNIGVKIQARRCTFVRQGGWLRVILPSGRSLCYPAPKVDSDGKISYMGIHQFTRKWQRIDTYSGKLFENICQAVARDIMAYAMVEAEAQGYKIVLTVHDELICYAHDAPEYSIEGLERIMSQQPAWAEGLPLAAAGYEGYRYRKD